MSYSYSLIEFGCIGVKFTSSESVTLTFCTPTRLTVGVFLSTFDL